MFGFPIRVELDGTAVTLRPFKKDEMEHFASLFKSMIVHRYTMGMGAVTTEDEIKWQERISESKSEHIWAIVPDDSDKPIGTTGLHGVHASWRCAHSGIIIANPNYWKKGIAYRAHLARTWYAVNTLNLLTIQSMVRVPNEGSLKALLKVGYRVSGKHDRNAFRDGKYMDTYVLSWINPLAAQTLYPEGVPDELNESLAKAKEALEIAEKACKFI